ncbi:uncharacterized protein LOC115874950 [Sitophilus oryzae]|uniref:Uncharacterized protein LOC115874950 n=1 Tax=Sitophilus oryzae TaxID=7048 RepID=A0A6J2X5B3_SITOR|nr:uncharacterized protein LOC115874950 [Sitophilus oryzae]XP_030746119.1 uncharacterized protein LOC115874950 [Sitophilus oryzae]
MRGPPLSMHNIPERPTDAATTFMGPYMRPSQKQKQKEMERIGRDIKFYKSDAGRQVMEMERRHGMRRELVAPCSPVGEEDHPFDEPIPRGLPPPLAPHHGSPIRRPHYTRVVDPFPQVELQPLQFENFGPCGPPPLHPDLREVAEWEPPFDLGETTALSAESHGDELMYSPEPLPGPEPLTPPSVGKGPCGTYSPATSPPLGILESPDLRMYDPHDLKIFDEHLADQEDVRSFFDRSPQPGPSTGVEADFDFFLETKSAKGREGLKPKPQFFGGYGEKPKKYLPRWYGQRGPNLNIISEEGDIPPSPPVSSHDTTCGPCDTSGLDEYLLLEQQLAQEAASHQNSLAFDERRRQVAITDMAEQADRQLIMSPEQREFEMLEEQMSQQRRPGRTSGRREFADRSRRAMIDEMAEEAERNWMDRMRVPSPPQWAPSSPQRVPSPCPVETFGPELGSRLDTSGVMDQSFGQYVTPPCSPAAREEFEQFTPPISPRGIGVCTPQLPEAGNLADIYQEDTRGFLEESFIGAQSPLNLSDGGVPGYDYEGAEQMVLGDAGGFPEMSGIPGAGTLEEETFPELSPGRRNPNLERYIENMQRQQEAVRLEEQASRQRRMQRYSNAMEELYQQNLPSPVSPGPDADFLANVYMHHVPPSFAQGERLYMRGGMPRRAPCPGLDTITEPRVRITSPKPSPKRHKHKHGKQVVPPPPRPGRTFSARRVEEARKLYREISRQTETSMLSERSRLAQRQGAVPRPRGVAPSIARPSAQPPPPRPFTGFVPSQVASQSGARSRVIQQQGAVPRYEGVRRPFTGFVPSQVQAPSQGRAGSGGSGQGRSGCGGSGQGRSGCGGSGQGKSGCGSQ